MPKKILKVEDQSKFYQETFGALAFVHKQLDEYLEPTFEMQNCLARLIEAGQWLDTYQKVMIPPQVEMKDLKHDLC